MSRRRRLELNAERWSLKVIVIMKRENERKYRWGWGVEEIETVKEGKYFVIWWRKNNNKEGHMQQTAMVSIGRGEMKVRF